MRFQAPWHRHGLNRYPQNYRPRIRRPIEVPCLRDWLSGEHAPAQRMAGTAFLIRVAGAAVIYPVAGPARALDGRLRIRHLRLCLDLAAADRRDRPLGLPLSAQRIIPEYTKRSQSDWLRGFLLGSRWTGVCDRPPWRHARRGRRVSARRGARARHHHAALSRLRRRCRSTRSPACWTASRAPTTAVNTRAAAAVRAAPADADRGDGGGAAGGIPTDATTAMVGVRLRHLDDDAGSVVPVQPAVAARSGRPDGLRVARLGHDLAPIFAVWAFYTLLTYTDVLVLRQFRPPEEVAIYYAAAKTLALVAFIYFSVAAAVAHRFAGYHVAGDRERSRVRSPTPCAGRSGRRCLTACMLALGEPILWLFGPISSPAIR